MKKILTSALALSFFAVIGCGEAPKKAPEKPSTPAPAEKDKKPDAPK